MLVFASMIFLKDSIGTLSCNMVSRSRIVTVLSSKVWWSTVTEKGVPIASGLYLVHIKIKTDQGEKERVLKWFGIMRPTDITAF